jgi:hypothetical protein
MTAIFVPPFCTPRKLKHRHAQKALQDLHVSTGTIYHSSIEVKPRVCCHPADVFTAAVSFVNMQPDSFFCGIGSWGGKLLKFYKAIFSRQA